MKTNKYLLACLSMEISTATGAKTWAICLCSFLDVKLVNYVVTTKNNGNKL